MPVDAIIVKYEDQISRQILTGFCRVE